MEILSGKNNTDNLEHLSEDIMDDTPGTLPSQLLLATFS